MLRLRIAASASPDCADTFSPASQYSPPEGVSRQPSRFMKVDFPEPEGPMTATNSPAAMSSDTPFSAVTS
jgi:hypothetical protein